MLTHERTGRPSDPVCLAAGIFARMIDAIDRGRFVEAAQARARLAALGYVVHFRRPIGTTRGRRPEGGGR